jgi:hypothetical protein
MFLNTIANSEKVILACIPLMWHSETSNLSKQNEQKERKNTCSQTSRLENPEELQLHHNHEEILFFTVLLLFAQ